MCNLNFAYWYQSAFLYKIFLSFLVHISLLFSIVFCCVLFQCLPAIGFSSVAKHTNKLTKPN
jgi:hypothetical protein